MEQLIQLLIYIVIFAIVAAGLYYVCKKFELPQPVLWICGAVLLIIVLIFIAGQVGAGSGLSVLPHTR
jgi:hypothetical protein